MQDDPISLYESASDEQLHEIIRQAELRLNEQGQVNRSVDQKAVQLTVLFGTLAAAGFPASLQAWQNNFAAFGSGAFSASLLCFGCSLLSMVASFPGTFAVVGNDPSNWIEDLASNKSAKRSAAETAHHYDKGLKWNRARMATRRYLLSAALTLFCLAAPIGLLVASVIASG